MSKLEPTGARQTVGARHLDAVVSHHLDGFRSGVARFNELLARELGVPLLGIDDVADAAPAHPLLSFKASELDQRSRSAIEAWLPAAELPAGPSWELFLHEYTGTVLERRLVEGADRVVCGNLEIEAAVRPLTTRFETLWTPGLVLDDRPIRPTELTVFSFGMAHKIRIDMFGRLKELLDASGRTYAVHVSAANHETASLRDAELVFDEMHRIFPDTLYFLGNLSDVAISNYLASATYFAAFFANGVRANNTSVASALERGTVVITNLDEFSPPELVHLENVIDIDRCESLPGDPEVLEQLRARARETARERTWSRLVDRLTR
jgi:hypothetical protein